MNMRFLAGCKTRFHAACLTLLVGTLAVTTFAGSAFAQETAAPPATEAPAATDAASAQVDAAGAAVAASAAAAVEAAEAAPAAAAPAEEAAPVVDKGDVAWMLTSTLLVLLMVVPGLGAVLRRHGPRQERAVGAGPGRGGVLAAVGAVDRLWLQPGVLRRGCVGRQPRQAVPQGRDSRIAGRHLHRRRQPAGVRVRRLPADLRRHHRRTDRRCLRRAGEVRRGAAVRGDLVHAGLPADRTHGVGRRRLPVREGRAGLRRWHRGPHQRGRGRPDRFVLRRQAPGLRPRPR